jgi:ferric-dicitrate binding protein FerR (iron transport regulator)
MGDSNIHDIIGKYLANEITDSEVLIFNEWVTQCNENLKEFELHKKVWEETRIRYNNLSSDLVFRDVLNKIDDHHEAEVSSTPKKAHHKISGHIGLISKIAATLLIIFTFIYLINSSIQDSPIEDSSVAMIEKINPAGQKSKIFLPDGSEVWLNAESKISYPHVFSDSVREVLLNGEAFFSVVRDPEKPFLVRAGNVSTTVLGTSFNMYAYDNEPSTYIALQSGKVRVDIKNEKTTQQMYLAPGEGISYDKANHQTVKEEFDKDLLLGWKDGIIKFEDANVGEVFNKLSRWYGVDFEIKNTKNQVWTYEGTYKDETLDNVLKGISFTKSFSYKFVNPKYVIVELN